MFITFNAAVFLLGIYLKNNPKEEKNYIYGYTHTHTHTHTHIYIYTYINIYTHILLPMLVNKTKIT